jgi:hypothetical protein
MIYSYTKNGRVSSYPKNLREMSAGNLPLMARLINDLNVYMASIDYRLLETGTTCKLTNAIISRGAEYTICKHCKDLFLRTALWAYLFDVEPNCPSCKKFWGAPPRAGEAIYNDTGTDSKAVTSSTN